MRLVLTLMLALCAWAVNAQPQEMTPPTVMKCIKPWAMMLSTFESNPDLKADLQAAHQIHWMEITHEQRQEWEMTIHAMENVLSNTHVKTWTVVEPSTTVSVEQAAQETAVNKQHHVNIIMTVQDRLDLAMLKRSTDRCIRRMNPH